MRKLTLLLPLAFTVAVPMSAASTSKSQSYFTYDDGGTIVRIEGDLTKAQALQIAASLA